MKERANNMVVTTDIPYMQDRLNTKRLRKVKNTPRTEYNCGGYALDTFSWYHPYSRQDGTLDNIIEAFEEDYDKVLDYTVKYMLEDFKGKLRVIANLNELQDNEEAVAYRIEMNNFIADFHYVRRKRNGSWYGKLGGCPTIHRYTEEQVFDCESEAWLNGRYNSEMILFALIVK
jgi:hypothetical protein